MLIILSLRLSLACRNKGLLISDDELGSWRGLVNWIRGGPPAENVSRLAMHGPLE